MPAVADVGVNPLVAVQAAASIHIRGAAAAAGVQAAVALVDAEPAVAPQTKQQATPSKPMAAASDIGDRPGVVTRRQLRWRQEAAGEGALRGGGGGGAGYKARVVDL